MTGLRLQLLIVVAVACSFQALVPWLPPGVDRGVSDAVILLLAGTGAIRLLRRTRMEKGRARAATIIGAASAGLWAVANAALLVNEFHPMPTVFTAANFLSVAAALLLPVAMHFNAPSVPGAERYRGFLDVAAVSGSVFALAWLYILAPAAGPGDSRIMTSSFAVLLTVPEVVAVALAVVTMSRDLGAQVGRSPRVLGAASVVLAATALLAMRNASDGSAWWAKGVGAGYVLGAGLVMVASRLETASNSASATGSRLFRTLGWASLPYAPITLAVTATALELVRAGTLSPVLVWVLLVTFGLVLLRQYLTVSIVRGLAFTLDQQRVALAHQAHHDALTGLPNRAAFHDRGSEMISRHAEAAVLLLDLDGFKPVNDRLGHAAGDEVLVAVAGRLNGSLRAGDLVARLGGDEFAVVLAGPADEPEARRVADRILHHLAEPIRIANDELVSVGGSIGVAVGTDDLDDLLRRADIAMYSAKAAGKACAR